MLLCRLLILLWSAQLCTAEPPAVISPRRIVLPATEFTLRLGMPLAAAKTALRPLELDERGEVHNRIVYSTAVDVGQSDYTVDLTVAGDSLVDIAITAIDSGLVDHWFRSRVDSLPLSASYERTFTADELIRETWTTFEAVWLTERPEHPQPGRDMTYWEFHLR